MKPYYKHDELEPEIFNFFQRIEYLKNNKFEALNILHTQLYEILSNKKYELCDKFLEEFIKREFPMNIIAEVLKFTMKYKKDLRSRELLYQQATGIAMEKSGSVAMIRGLE